MAGRPMSGAGKAGEINRAASEMPKRQTAGRINTGGVGRETPVSPRVVQEGGSAAEAAGNPLRGAMDELHRQHPHHYSDHGPHHGTSEHRRHEGLPFGKGR